MDASTEKPAGRSFSMPLAGLQAGMLAALWMLAWLGAHSVWERRGFWTPENLLASTFYGGSAVRDSFTSHTLSGLALYLTLYSIIGSLLALLLRLRLPPVHLLIVTVLAAVGWYYASFHGFWKVISPLVPLLHPERPMLVGHVIYGAVVARFPRYLPRGAPLPTVEAAPTVSGPL